MGAHRLNIDSIKAKRTKLSSMCRLDGWAECARDCCVGVGLDVLEKVKV